MESFQETWFELKCIRLISCKKKMGSLPYRGMATTRTCTMYSFSSTFSYDFWPLTVTPDDLGVISDDFFWSCHIIVEEIKSIMGARAERSSPSWVCIPQKLLAITRDFWNANPFGWTPFHTGARDGFSISIRIYMCISYVKTCVKTGMEAFNPSPTASRKRNICI